MNAPGFDLQPLKGDKKRLWPVTVKANWRVTFQFVDGDAEVVNYKDYHWEVVWAGCTIRLIRAGYCKDFG